MMNMQKAIVGLALAAALMGGRQEAVAADAGDVSEGEKLYVSHCKICHGDNTGGAASGARKTLPGQRVHLALESSLRPVTDVPLQLSFAPPFGPNLRGVYMRPAGTVEDFDYSAAFLKALKGMEWSDAALDVWITNTQAWVPGVYMYYRQSDPTIRRKIIDYLKAYR